MMVEVEYDEYDQDDRDDLRGERCLLPFGRESNIFPFAKQCDLPIIKSVEHKIQTFDQNDSPISDQH